jgi:uncharacterized membrane protein YbhN (UPF0104 family)
VRHPVAAAAITVAAVAAAAFTIQRYSHRVVAFRQRLVQGFSVLGNRRLYLTSVVTWQAADWFLRIVEIYCFLHAFGVAFGLGLESDLENALLVQVTQSVSTLVPITPAGIGTEQALVAYVLSGKASITALVSFSVGMKLTVVAVNVLVGFGAILVMLGTLRWRRHLQREGEAAELLSARSTDP